MKPTKPVTITIDGPAGSGKGTTAKLLAKKLGFKYLDTGAMWRALGIYLKEKNIHTENIEKEDLVGIEIDFSPNNHVRINEEDYESKIRTVEASILASQIAGQKNPRHLIISTGQQIIQSENYVLEGRDTGTIWAPDAHVKIFLIADPVVRAHRRWLELQAQGARVTEEEVLQNILERDHRDMTRLDGPLIQSPDAIVVDTTHITIPEQVERIYEIVQKRRMLRT